MMSRTIEEILAPKPEARPRIYAYSIDDKAHTGLLKVGQTTRNVKQRVGEQLKTAAIKNYKIELDEPRSVIWMHGADLHVTAASVEGGERIDASFAQVHPSGVAKVTFERPVGPGRDDSIDRECHGRRSRTPRRGLLLMKKPSS